METALKIAGGFVFAIALVILIRMANIPYPEVTWVRSEIAEVVEEPAEKPAADPADEPADEDPAKDEPAEEPGPEDPAEEPAEDETVMIYVWTDPETGAVLNLSEDEYNAVTSGAEKPDPEGPAKDEPVDEDPAKDEPAEEPGPEDPAEEPAEDETKKEEAAAPTLPDNAVTLLEGLVSFAGFPEEAETVRWGFDLGRTDDDCGFKPLAWLICEGGVLSFDHDEEDENGRLYSENPSAVWSGGANVDNAMTTNVEQFLLPGNGYMKTTWAGGTMRWDDKIMHLEPKDGVSYMFVSRGIYAEEGGGQTPVEYEVTDEYRGATKIMRYPIEDPTASGFYSWDHFDEDVLHQLSGDNCVFDGCDTVIIIANDVNRDNLTVAEYTAADGYQLLWTNSRSE